MEDLSFFIECSVPGVPEGGLVYVSDMEINTA
jgi:hypothetical protein